MNSANETLGEQNLRPAATDLANPIHAALCLSLTAGIGPKTFRNLVDSLGSAEAVLNAAPSVLREIPGVGTKLAKSIANAASTVDITDELQRCDDHKIDLVAVGHEDYPTRLSEIQDAPTMLYCRGDLLPQDELAIAIVGTRHATSYGVRQAERLAQGLATAGFTIVSGLARGIDAAAHRGAIAAGGRTIAVLGSGLLNMYPPEHAELSLEIAASGAVLSEYPTRQPPKSGSFPQRNRIVTGMSLGVIVVEAAERSGALISARHAMEQNRDVFAVPGQIDSRVSSGCHKLIRDGAVLVTCIDDVIEHLGPLATPAKLSDPGTTETSENTAQTIHHPAELQLNEQETQVLQAIQPEPTQIDSLVDATGLPIHRILATLSVLEMKRLIRRVSGSEVCRN